MKKRHHFLPQFYLRRFASSGARGRIWTYDSLFGTVRASGVKNTAYETHLYSVPREDGTRTDEFEDALADIEGRAAPVLDKLLRNESVQGQERADLSSLFALMVVRTDSFRRQYAEVSLGMTQLLLSTTAAHDVAFNSLINKLEEEFGDVSGHHKKKLREGMLDPDRFGFVVNKAWTLNALRVHDALAPVFYRMNWTILNAKSPHYFVTGDNPVVKLLPDRFSKSFYGGGYADKRIEVTLPLSPERCLVTHWNNELPSESDITPAAVKDLNRVRAMHAERFLFADRQDFGIRRLTEKYKGFKPGFEIGGLGERGAPMVKLRRS